MIASAVNTSGFLQTALSELLRTELSARTQLRLRSTSDRVLTFIVHMDLLPNRPSLDHNWGK
jgi:hypothetical protein